MADKYVVGQFCFADEETYEAAVKEYKAVDSIRKHYPVANPKTAGQVYKKAVEEKVFSTIVGYSFLEELRRTILNDKSVRADELPQIPILKEEKEKERKNVVSVQEKGGRAERFRRLYEGQCILNRRLKLLLTALIILVAAFVFIDLKTEYSVFTYFTNYEAKMEEELIDKYEAWESELKAREEALENSR